MIRGILWDNDGVLVDTEKHYFEAVKSVVKAFGVNLTEETFHEFFMKKSGGVWHFAKENGATDQDVEAMITERNRLYSQVLESEDMAIDGVAETLARLAGKVKMGVVTSCRKMHFDIIHEKTGFMKYFDFVLTLEDIVNSKPDPEPYLKGIDRLGFPVEEIVAVEDSERGLTSALNAGLSCWAIPNGLSKYGNFKKADKVLTDIGEIPGLI